MQFRGIKMIYEYIINNGGRYEDNWDVSIFSTQKLTKEEFKTIVEKAHDKLLKKYDDFYIRSEDIARNIVKTDKRFFKTEVIITAVINDWGPYKPWEERFEGVYEND